MAITRDYGAKSRWEELRLRNSDSPLYEDKLWIDAAANEDTLYLYADALQKNDLSAIKNISGYSWLDSSSKLQGIMSNMYADDEKLIEREVAILDDEANVIGKEKRQMTDKQYINYMLSQEAAINKQMDYAMRREQWKEDNKWLAGLATVGGIILEFPAGFMRTVDNIFELGYALVTAPFVAGNKEITLSEAAEIIGGQMQGQARLFDKLGATGAIRDFQRRYTYIENYATGERGGLAGILANAVGTIGELVPSILISKGISAGLGKSGVSASTALKVGQRTGYITFYAAGEFGQSYKQHYNFAKANNLDVNYATIMLTDGLVTAGKMSVEWGLGKLMGGTWLDSKLGLQNKPMSVGKTTSLYLKGLYNYLGDALEEGIEEVLQDSVDVLAYQLLGKLVNSDYAQLSEFDAEDMFITFVTAAMSSLISGGFGILGTKRQTKVINGEVKKLSKMSSYAINLDFENAIRQYQNTIDYLESLDIDKLDDFDKQRANKYLQQAYEAVNMVTTLFETVGEERSAKIIKLLKSAQMALNEGNIENVRANTQQMIEQITGKTSEVSIEDYNKLSDKEKENVVKVYNGSTNFDESTLSDGQKSQIQYLKIEVQDINSADITAFTKKLIDNEVKGVIERSTKGEEIKSDLLTTEQKSKINSLSKSTKKVKQTIVVEQGTDIVTDANTGTVVVPKDVVNNISNTDLIYITCQKFIIDNLANNPKFKQYLPELTKVYLGYTGKKSADVNEIAQALYSDPEFYKAALIAANKEAYEILAQLTFMLNEASGEKVGDAIYKKQLDDLIGRLKNVLVEYLKTQPNADYRIDFLKDRWKEIENARYDSNILYNWLDGKITKEGRDYLHNKINMSQMSKADKYKYNAIVDSKSSDTTSKMIVIDALRMIYAFTFYKNYDGITYLPQNSLANLIVNRFLQAKGLTLETVFSKNAITDADKDYVRRYNSGQMDKLDISTKEGIVKLRRQQAFDFTGGRYDLAISAGGELSGTVAVGRENQVISNRYAEFEKADSEEDAKGKRERKLTDKFKIRSEFNNEFLRSQLNETLPESSKRAITLNDVIQNPDLLNDKAKLSIRSKYSTTMSTSAIFLYLRDEISKQSNGTRTISFSSYGDPCFVDLVEIEKVLVKNWRSKIDKAYQDAIAKIDNPNYDADILTLSDLVNPAFINDKLKNIFIDIGQPSQGAQGEALANKIILHTLLNAETSYSTFLHELEHEFQYANSLAQGFGINALQSRWAKGDDTTKRQIVEIVKAFDNMYTKIMNSVVSETMRDYEAEKSISGKNRKMLDEYVFEAKLRKIDDMVYRGNSGEMGARGLDDNILYIPIVITSERVNATGGLKDRITIQLPNGQHYTYLAKSVDLLSKPVEYSTAWAEDNLIDPSNSYISEDIDSLDTVINAKEQISKTNILELQTNYNNTRDLSTVQNIPSQLSAKDRALSIAALHSIVDPKSSLRDFVHNEYPYIRIQQSRDFNYLPVYIGKNGYNAFQQYCTDNNINISELSIVYGYITPAKTTGYVNFDTLEVFVDADILANNDAFFGTYTNDELQSYVEVSDISNGETQYFPGPEMPANKIPTDNDTEWEKLNEKEYTHKPKHEYKSREMYKNKRTGKTKTKYKYDNKRVQVGKNTDLPKSYVGSQIGEDFAKFLKLAKDYDGPYKERIDKGTLTRHDVLEDFRQGKITDAKTFNMVNDAFFQNENITSPEQLEGMVAQANAYWAAAKILKIADMDESMLDTLNADALDAVLNIILSNDKSKLAYEELLKSYDYLAGKELDIEEAYIRNRLMKIYDGTLESARKAISTVRSMAAAGYVSAGTKGIGTRIETTALDKQVKGKKEGQDTDVTTGDLTPDERFDLIDAIDATRNEKIASIMDYQKNAVREKIREGKVTEANMQKYTEKIAKYKKWLNKLTDAQIDSIFVELFIKDINNDIPTELQETVPEKNAIDELYRKHKNDVKNLVKGINHQLGTIRRNLNDKQKKLFYKDNSDIVNSDLTLKDDIIHDKDSVGRLIYKDANIIREVKSRINQLSKDVRADKYNTSNALKFAKKADKQIKTYQKQLALKLNKQSTDTNYRTVTFVNNDESITIETTKEVPEILKPLLSYYTEDAADTNVQYLSGDNDVHIVASMVDFVENNVERLNAITQSDALDIIDFFLSSDIITAKGDRARLESVKLYLLAYLLKQSDLGIYNIPIEVKENVKNYMQRQVSMYATGLSTWNNALKMFKPAEATIRAFYTQFGVNITEAQLARLTNAYARLTDSDVNRRTTVEDFNKVRDEIYKEILNQNSRKFIKSEKTRLNNMQKELETLEAKKNKDSKDFDRISEIKSTLYGKDGKAAESLQQMGFEITKGKGLSGSEVTTTKRMFTKKGYDNFLNKVWNMERMFMLSGPGTAIRNHVSNILIDGIYVKGKQILPGLSGISAKIGNFVLKTFSKKGLKQGQYKIVGTEVTANVKNFIQTNFLDNGFLNNISDGLNRYDVRRESKNKTTADVVSDLIMTKLSQDVYNKNHKVAAFFGKMLSDDAYIKRLAIRYFGKILTEHIDNMPTSTDAQVKAKETFLNQGATREVLNLFADAWIYAAEEFMHKTNIVHSLEKVIREKGGTTGYFIWKQIAPFAASSLNWFMEGLKYTPIGLAHSIIQFARMEKSIDKISQSSLDARSKKQKAISPEFAQYKILQNMGKGVIGTIGTIIGIILAATGLARLDDDDDKYKLVVGDVSIDISNLFSTQGILMGMSLTGQIVRATKCEADFWDIFNLTTNQLFDDSIFASMLSQFRYSDTVADSIQNYITYTLPNMFVPNLLKTITTVTKKYDVKYSKGFLGRLEKMTVDAIPFLDRAYPKMYDIYTGEVQTKYVGQYFIDVFNKSMPIKIKQAKMSELERLAITLGVNKKALTGNYTVNEQSVQLKPSGIEAINTLYGKLNNKELTNFVNNKTEYSVKDKNGKFVKLHYKQMTDAQIATTFNNIMTKNSGYAKVFALTNKGYKYYTTESERAELRKIGITKNIYLTDTKHSGFIK